MTAIERERYYAGVVKSLAEHYGYTPAQIGELTIYQAEVLLAEDTKEATNIGKKVISYSEYRRLLREQGSGN